MEIKYGQGERYALLSGRNLKAAPNCLKQPQHAFRTHGSYAHGKRQNCALPFTSTPDNNHAGCYRYDQTHSPFLQFPKL